MGSGYDGGGERGLRGLALIESDQPGLFLLDDRFGCQELGEERIVVRGEIGCGGSGQAGVFEVQATGLEIGEAYESEQGFDLMDGAFEGGQVAVAETGIYFLHEGVVFGQNVGECLFDHYIIACV